MQPKYSTLYTPWQQLFKLLLFAMGVVYLAGCFTPLHIHFDSVRYYNIKDCIEFGCPENSEAASDYLPYGYTGLLILLSKLGILNSFSIVLVNCLFLFAGLYFVKQIFKAHVHPYLFAVVVLFSWTILKFAIHPLSEMQYIFFSMASLYSFHLYRQKKRLAYLALAFFMAIFTVLTRTVGISLMAALFLGVAWQYKSELLRIIKKNKLLLIVIALVGVAVILFAKQLKILDYTSLLKGPLENGVGNFLAENLKNHFTELAEVFLNMPANKVQAYMPETLSAIIFIVIGVCCFAWFMYNTFSGKSKIPFYIRAYILFYVFIIMNWPYYDPRFWVPVLPLMAVIMLRTPFNRQTVVKYFSRLYLAAYLLLGLLAAAYALYVGFNKERFARNQAAGDYRNEYEIHFFGKPLSDTATHIDQNVVDILKKYD